MTPATQPDTDQASAKQGSRAEETAGAIEAVLLTADKAVAPDRLAAAVGLAAPDDQDKAAAEALDRLKTQVDGLNEQYAATGRAFRIEKVAGGYRLMTLPEFAPFIAAFQQHKGQQKLSKAALETLAIIAYRQPVTRAEVEGIRGVACGEVLKTLMDHRLVTIQGRAEELGRPILYGTTRQFLETFGLATIKDLPAVGKHEPGATA